jgi:hypothetical protein
MGRRIRARSNVEEMQSDSTTDDMVHESALQLWAAAQTDFDPFQVPPEEWGPDLVPVRDADIAHDTRLDLDVVRDSLRRLDGTRVVVRQDAGDLAVTRVIPDDVPL